MHKLIHEFSPRFTNDIEFILLIIINLYGAGGVIAVRLPQW